MTGSCSKDSIANPLEHGASSNAPESLGPAGESVVAGQALRETSEPPVQGPPLDSAVEPSTPKPSREIVWPHEYVGREDRPPIEKRSTVKLLRSIGGLAVRSRRGLVADELPRSRRAVVRLNGPEAAPLADKFSFVELVRDMGYTAPRQILVSGEDTVEARIPAITSALGEVDHLICKPHAGKNGLGIVELEADDLPSFLETAEGAYIIQERVAIDGEVRYIRQVDGAVGVIHRVYYEKTVPKLASDGVQTLGQLIAAHDMPLLQRRIMRDRYESDLNTVLPAGHTLHIPPGKGYPEKTTVEWGTDNQQRVQNMDAFMERFGADLEANIGTSLTHLCFDVGFKDFSVLDGDYNYEAIKENAVFFEQQTLYTLFRYVNESSRSAADKYRVFKILYGRMAFDTKEQLLGVESRPLG
jgi:hypothetical protein